MRRRSNRVFYFKIYVFLVILLHALHIIRHADGERRATVASTALARVAANALYSSIDPFGTPMCSTMMLAAADASVRASLKPPLPGRCPRRSKSNCRTLFHPPRETRERFARVPLTGSRIVHHRSARASSKTITLFAPRLACVRPTLLGRHRLAVGKKLLLSRSFGDHTSPSDTNSRAPTPITASARA